MPLLFFIFVEKVMHKIESIKNTDNFLAFLKKAMYKVPPQYFRSF
jgi:hypothetical protein